MAKTKEQKRKIIEDLREKVSRQKSIIFVNFNGLKNKDLLELRKRLKSGNSQFLVVKKTLMNLVFKEKDIKIEPKKMTGEVALAFGFEDEILPAKIIYQFSQENNNLKILGGMIESQKGEFLEPQAVVKLAQLLSKDELLAGLTQTFSNLISKFLNILRGDIKGLIQVLANIKT